MHMKSCMVGSFHALQSNRSEGKGSHTLPKSLGEEGVPLTPKGDHDITCFNGADKCAHDSSVQGVCSM